jgi:hypothetical protein
MSGWRTVGVLVLLYVMMMGVTRSARAEVIVDPDAFTPRQDISNAYPGVTLSAVGDFSGHDGKVYSQPNSNASTGSWSFGNSWGLTPSQWGSGWNEACFRADFDIPASWVAIDAISNDSRDYAQLLAYDDSDVLLGSYQTARLGTNQIDTMWVSSPGGDISYILAGGINGDTLWLDNMRYTLVPEPSSSLLILASALMVLHARARRRAQ